MYEILNFKDNGTRLCLLIDDNQNIVYAKKENGIITYDVTKEQRELIKNIFIQLLPSNNITDFGYLKYDKKDIRHFYDLNNHFHIFCESDGKITEDSFFLNYIFNNQEEYWALSNKRRYGSRKYIKRKVKLKNQIITVCVTAAFIISSSILFMKGASKVIDWVKYYNDKQQYEQGVLAYQDKNLTIEDITLAIYNNENLTQEEKEFFLSKKDYFLDNLEYFDYYTVLDNLKKLQVEYVPTKDVIDPGKYGDFIYFGEGKGKITIYQSTGFSDAPKYALSHEFLHAFTMVSGEENHFYEIVNVVLNNEYFGGNVPLYDNGYQTLQKYFYIMAELVNPEVLKQYHATNDIDFLIQELAKIIPDYQKAIDLMNNIDSVYRISALRNTDQASYEKLQEEYHIKCQEIMETLKLYYETKYQKPVENDLYSLFWFNTPLACTKLASELGFGREELLAADDITRIHQFKKILHKTGNDNLTLFMCDKVDEVTNNYTLDEVLSGQTGYMYLAKEEIDLPITKEGFYQVITYQPVHYIKYEVPSNEKFVNKGM